MNTFIRHKDKNRQQEKTDKKHCLSNKIVRHKNSILVHQRIVAITLYIHFMHYMQHNIHTMQEKKQLNWVSDNDDWL